MVPALAGTLTVRLPRVRGGWDNHELPVYLPDGRSDRLAGALWTSPVDDGVGTVMADTLRTRGAFAAVLARDDTRITGGTVVPPEEPIDRSLAATHRFAAIYAKEVK